MFGWRGQVLAVLAGLALGSYAVTAAIRFVRLEPSSSGRSRCDGCGTSLSFAQTVPLLSYFRLKGACSACGGRIDRLHLIGEFGGAVVLSTALLLHDPLRMALAGLLGLTLLVSAVIDLKTQRLPDRLTAVIAVLAAGLAYEAAPWRLAIGAGLGLALALALQAVRVLRARAGRDPGVGLGDLKLIAAVSLWLGAAAPWMLALAAGLGLVAAAIVRPQNRRLAFGPAIAVATWIVGVSVELGPWPPAI